MKVIFIYLLILFWSIDITGGRHFDGGTITWAPINPYDNSSSVGITITQSYSWSYPTITCANNVPISTSGRSTQNWNLTCVVDCTTDGGYSTKPIDILTDCTSSSSSLGMMTSSRSHNLTLTAGSYFYLANDGSAWVALNYPSISNLQWSIVTFIDLRMRPDGFINTPPVASVVSPQYAIVNRTIQINIPVSDVNAGDDVRCRWSTYTPGYRRRKRSYEEERTTHLSAIQFYRKVADNGEIIHSRKKRSCGCGSTCGWFCSCSCTACDSSICTGSSCTVFTGCTASSTTIATTTAAPTTTTITTVTTVPTTVATTTVSTTTIDTPGTLASTSSFIHQQALDECGGICYPGSVPNGTTMSNCTITFTGTKVGVWYAVAIQVEDFINDTSTTPMSSVPVQLLIYVLPTPICSKAPIIFPLNGCLEVQVGVQINFNIYAMNECNPSVSNVSAMLVSSGVNGMIGGNLASSSTNSSLSYLPFTWTPQTNQIGSQQLCVIAYTTEQVQSTQYCVTFTVKATSDLCVTTTTTTTTTTSATSTTTTSATTTTTSQTTATTTSTTTSATTTTTTETTTTSSTSTSTTSSTSSTSTSSTSTSSTSTSSTSTSTSSTSTSTTTSSTSTSSTSTSTTSTTTSTTTSSTSTSSTSSTSTTSTTTSTSTTTTSTTTTSATTTTATSTTTTSVTTTTVTTTKATPSSINWPLIVGLSLLAALLAMCCCCYCLYRYCWSPAARRDRRKAREIDAEEHTLGPRHIIEKARKSRVSRLFRANSLVKKDHQIYNALDATYSTDTNVLSDSCNVTVSDTIDTSMKDEEDRPKSTVSVKRIKLIKIKQDNNNETKDTQIISSAHHNNNRITSIIPRSEDTSVRLNKIFKLDIIQEDQINNSNITQPESSNTETLSRSKSSRVNVKKVSRSKTAAVQQGPSLNNCNSETSALEIQPTSNRSKTSSNVRGTTAKANSGVTVTKIARTATSARPNHS